MDVLFFLGLFRAENERANAMARICDDAYLARTKGIADNLKKELRRLATGTPWQDAEKLVDLLGAAQTAYAIEDVAPPESKEAHALWVAAVRFERLLRRRRDKLAKENPFLTKDVRARFDEDLEVVRRYTYSLNAEAQVALAVRDAFDCANNSYPEHHKIPTSLKDDGPLIALTRAALEYTPIKDKTPQTLCKSLERWPALRRQ
jgi:hypothetical protein